MHLVHWCHPLDERSSTDASYLSLAPLFGIFCPFLLKSCFSLNIFFYISRVLLTVFPIWKFSFVSFNGKGFLLVFAYFEISFLWIFVLYFGSVTCFIFIFQNLFLSSEIVIPFWRDFDLLSSETRRIILWPSPPTSVVTRRTLFPLMKCISVIIFHTSKLLCQRTPVMTYRFCSTNVVLIIDDGFGRVIIYWQCNKQKFKGDDPKDKKMKFSLVKCLVYHWNRNISNTDLKKCFNSNSATTLNR